MSQPTPPPLLTLTLKIPAGVAVLGLPYLGRSLLEPITLAAMIGFVMAPTWGRSAVWVWVRPRPP